MFRSLILRSLRCFLPLFVFPVAFLGTQELDDVKYLAAFANPELVWGRGIESVIESAYRKCFKSYFINGQLITVRIPFAENHERDSLVEGGWEFLGKGKSDSAELWPVIDATLKSKGFAEYTEDLKSGKEQVIIFDIAAKSWKISQDIFDIARMKAGSYHGLPHKPYVLVSGNGVKDTDVYNYLYCVAWIGMDCSGFVWHTLSYIAKKGGINLDMTLRRSLGIPRGENASYYTGTAFYNSNSKEIIAVNDAVKNIRPADILLFRAKDGAMAHSAIIQSVDFTNGIIRYLQDTDEAPQSERGVHESYIYFNPKKTNVSLKDSSLRWSQQRFSPFPGEKESAFSEDGERYRAYGGGRVVRMRTISTIAGKFH
jgi:hypothetical protein